MIFSAAPSCQQRQPENKISPSPNQSNHLTSQSSFAGARLAGKP
ncbi:hypothetical protein [Kingella oralis]